jgi:prepilin-type N-terminal cleavage/methylation domain-containing protein
MRIRNLRFPTSNRSHEPSPSSLHRSAFTLTELMIAIAIFVLLLAVAVPLFRTITGTRSIAAGTNVLSATLNRVRMEAIGFQQHRGVMFYLDQNTGRVGMITVAEAAAPTGAVNLGALADVWFDVVGDAEGALLPAGIGLEGQLSVASLGNRYIGFNPSRNLFTNALIPSVNRYGCIMAFTPEGRLFLGTPGTVWWTGTAPTNTSDFLFGPGQTLASLANLTGSSQFVPIMCLSMFESDEFLTQFAGSSDAWQDDWMMMANEVAKETWLNNNATPFLTNRYNGTLIKAE